MKPTNPRLLLIAKQFFTEGKATASYGDDLAAMKAVLFLDLAVELMLNILIADFGPGDDPGRDDIKWSQLWQQAIRAVKDVNVMTDIPHHRDLKTLHEMRNLAQHRGVTPNSAEVSRFIPPVERMLTACFLESYGLNFEAFQLWDEIRNPELKRLLGESQQALELSDPIMAWVGVEVAFQAVITALQRDTAGVDGLARIYRATTQIRLPRSSRGSVAEVADQVGQRIAKLEEQFDSKINIIQDNAVIANLGISMAETGRYRKIRSAIRVSVGVAASGDWHVYVLGDQSAEEYRQAVSFSLSYVVGLVLLAQEAYPEAIDGIRIRIPLTEQAVWKQRREETPTLPQSG